MTCIELHNVVKRFDKKTVINDITFSFETEKNYGIVGSNGCGKSVLFKLISGLMRPTRGSIVVNGVYVGEKGSMPQDIGILIEHPGFLPNMSGMENLQLLASIRKVAKQKDIEDALRKVALYADKDNKVKNYSLGMLQRLGIAQALMEKPKILLLDEPFNSMDIEGVEELRHMIREYVVDMSATMLITSHNREDIDVLSDSVISLRDGKLLSDVSI